MKSESMCEALRDTMGCYEALWKIFIIRANVRNAKGQVPESGSRHEKADISFYFTIAYA